MLSLYAYYSTTYSFSYDLDSFQLLSFKIKHNNNNIITNNMALMAPNQVDSWTRWYLWVSQIYPRGWWKWCWPKLLQIAPSSPTKNAQNQLVGTTPFNMEGGDDMAPIFLLRCSWACVLVFEEMVSR